VHPAADSYALKGYMIKVNLAVIVI